VAEHNKKGRLGEEKAVEYLQSKGYDILETNWRFGHKEIDIIALLKNMLFVIEVKTRSSKAFDKPYESVTKKKQDFLIEATEAYIIEKELDYEVQFDIISIYLLEKTVEIEHIQNAFNPQF